MQFRTLLPVLITGLCASQATAAKYNDCCMCHFIEGLQFCVKWNEATDTLSCGVGPGFSPGSRCSAERFYHPNDRLQANVSLWLGANEKPYRLDMGINPANCKIWKEVPTQWVGWGAYLFNGGFIQKEWPEVCTGYGAL